MHPDWISSRICARWKMCAREIWSQNISVDVMGKLKTKTNDIFHIFGSASIERGVIMDLFLEIPKLLLWSDCGKAREELIHLDGFQLELASLEGSKHWKQELYDISTYNLNPNVPVQLVQLSIQFSS